MDLLILLLEHHRVLHDAPTLNIPAQSLPSFFSALSLCVVQATPHVDIIMAVLAEATPSLPPPVGFLAPPSHARGGDAPAVGGLNGPLAEALVASAASLDTRAHRAVN